MSATLVSKPSTAVSRVTSTRTPLSPVKPWSSCSLEDSTVRDAQTSICDRIVDTSDWIPGYFYIVRRGGEKLWKYPHRLLRHNRSSNILHFEGMDSEMNFSIGSAGLALSRVVLWPGTLLHFVDDSPGCGTKGRRGEALVTAVDEEQTELSSDGHEKKFKVQFQANLRYTDLSNMSYRQVSARANVSLSGEAVVHQEDKERKWDLVRVDTTFASQQPRIFTLTCEPV